MTRLHVSPRWLHPARAPSARWRGWALLGICAVGLAYALVVQPLGSLVLIGGILFFGWLYDRPRTQRLQVERPWRPDDDFGSFVRAFSRRSGSGLAMSRHWYRSYRRFKRVLEYIHVLMSESRTHRVRHTDKTTNRR